MAFIKFKKKLIIAVLAAAAMLFNLIIMSPVVSCRSMDIGEALSSPATGKDLSQEEKLVVGSDSSYPPFSFKNGQGEANGFDIEVIREIGLRLDKEIQIRTIPFDSLYNEIGEGNIDLIISALTPSEDRKAVVEYSDPYFTMRYLMLTLSDTEIRLREDMAGQDVGMLRIDKGCLSEDLLARYKIAEYDDIRSMIADLRSREIEGLLITKPMAINILAQEKKMYRVLDNFKSEREFVIALSKNSGIKEEIDSIIDSMNRDGTMEEIYSRWFSMD